MPKVYLEICGQYDIPDNEGVFGPKTGLYPNFPYNDLRADVYHYDGSAGTIDWPWSGNSSSLFSGTDPVPRTDGCDTWNDSLSNFPPLTDYRRDIFTFHSPELMFKRPFLNPYEIRMYGAYSGESVGSFRASEEHPQNKLLRNGAAIIAGIIGVGYAIGQMQGTQQVKKVDATNSNTPWLPIWFLAGLANGTNVPGVNGIAAGASAGTGAGSVAANIILNALLDEGTKLLDVSLSGGSGSDIAFYVQAAIQQGLGLVPGMNGGGYERTYIKDKDTSLLPVIVKIITGVVNSRTNIAIGAQKIIDLMYNLISAGDFAFKYNSYGLFDSYHRTQSGIRFRSRNVQANYIGNTFTAFNTQFKINNLFRPDTVVIQTNDNFQIPQDLGAPQDRSRYCVGGDANDDYQDTYITNPNATQTKQISALYGSLKFNYDNQYGQIEGIKQVSMSGCLYQIDTTKPDRFRYETGPIFSGDTYVGRYTEKTIMPIFSDFLYGQPDQYPYNYLQRINIPYPRFWMDTRKYDTTELATELSTLTLSNGPGLDGALPNDLFYLDRGGKCGTSLLGLFGADKGGNSAFAMRYGYMYTHVNGILDFFVESEVLLPNRDWEDSRGKRHYDNFRYTDVDELFHAQIIKEDNNYVYDYSLSASRFVTNLIPGGVIQPRDYDPDIAETCFSYYPKRLIYSLQAQEEAKKDFWRVFLPNNYRDFKDQVNVIKPINKNGAIIFFPYQSPQMFQGIDQLQTDLNTKITLGDGGLFEQAFQNLVNSEMSNEYGSCESQRGIINTPFGFFFISQAQGKIFQQNGQSLNPISNKGMKWWFNKYLPSNLIRQFPEFEFSVLADNPVIGIGCQVIYDITDDIAYFCKKDFSLKEEYEGLVTYDSELDCFVTNGVTPIKQFAKPLIESIIGIEVDQGETVIDQDQPVTPGSKTCIEIGDPVYFDDCSWTVSYDPKAEAWISFHDWHPELCMSSINHFLTIKSGTTDIPQCPPGFVYDADLEKCVRLIDVTEDAVVSVDEITLGVPDRCPEGFTFNEEAGICEKITEAPVDCGELATVLKSGTNFNYGKFGARFYESTLGRPLPISATAAGGGYRLEDATGTELLYPFTTSGTGGGTGPLVPLWQDRLNTIGAWAENNPSGNDEPVQEWIGFTICITVSETKQYSVGFGCR